MKMYAFVDWDLVRSTPMRHTYRCGWREMVMGSRAYRTAKRPKRRHITIEWDGLDQLVVRTGKLLGPKSQWTTSQIRSIVFGLREMSDRELPAGESHGWLWFVRLTGKSQEPDGDRTLAEFLVAHQHDTPSTSRARVPARVQELINWLSQCTGRRAHGPTLVTDEISRKRILSHVE